MSDNQKQKEKETLPAVDTPTRDDLERWRQQLRLEKAQEIFRLQTEGHTLKEACEITGVNVRTFYNWISDGKLSVMLDEIETGRRRALQHRAQAALDEILGYMIKVATGQEKGRGLNPVQAARFVLALAGQHQPSARGPVVDNQFLPQFVTFVLERGSELFRPPVIDVEPVEAKNSPAKENGPAEESRTADENGSAK